MSALGNTYDTSTKSWGHARKVWREIRQAYPGGGTIANPSDFATAGVIKAGTPVKFDTSARTITAITDANINTAAATTSNVSNATAADNAAAAKAAIIALGINGYLQEDVPISSSSAVASGTVIFDGSLYEYMFDEDIAAALKQNTGTPMIVWVQ